MRQTRNLLYPSGTGGSNPSLSAIFKRLIRKFFVWCLPATNYSFANQYICRLSLKAFMFNLYPSGVMQIISISVMRAG